MRSANYNNGIGDWFVSDKKIAERQAALDLEAQKIALMGSIANQPASGNNLIILLPIAIVLIGGIIAIVVIKSKKGR